MAEAEEDDAASKVRVVCRFRPHNSIEDTRGGKPCIRISDDNCEVFVKRNDGKDQRFTFDKIFAPTEFGGELETQDDVFKFAGKPIIDDIFSGYNGTIFAYGQTSSGKTHTMQGPEWTEDPTEAGIIPRSIEGIFNRIRFEADAKSEFLVQVSYVEIYLERIRDLLDMKKHNLAIREHPTRGIYVENMTEHYAQSAQEMFAWHETGSQNRAQAATGMNAGSSRSHSVFVVTLSQKNTETGKSKKGKLYLVDLAGSEMVRKTGASGQQLQEAKMINSSLSALGKVINALTDGKSSHIPYRDSKLTRMLQESLGGNARTSLIICCSPSSYNVDETVSTIRFGLRAKRIENKAQVNENLSVEELQGLLMKSKLKSKKKDKLIKGLRAEIIKLQRQLGIAPEDYPGDENITFVDSDELQEQVKYLEKMRLDLESELAQKTEQVDTFSAIVHEKEQAGKTAVDKIEQLTEENEKLKTTKTSIEQQMRDFSVKVATKLSLDDLAKEAETCDVQQLGMMHDELCYNLDEKMATLAKLNKLNATGGLSAAPKLPGPLAGAATSSTADGIQNVAPGKHQDILIKLVQVHRTLLHKFATVEIDLSEANHKLGLRTERIKNLESNLNLAFENLNAQDTLHKKEVNKLRKKHDQETKRLKLGIGVEAPSGRMVKPLAGGQSAAGHS